MNVYSAGIYIHVYEFVEDNIYRCMSYTVLEC